MISFFSQRLSLHLAPYISCLVIAIVKWFLRFPGTHKVLCSENYCILSAYASSSSHSGLEFSNTMAEILFLSVNHTMISSPFHPGKRGVPASVLGTCMHQAPHLKNCGRDSVLIGKEQHYALAGTKPQDCWPLFVILPVQNCIWGGFKVGKLCRNVKMINCGRYFSLCLFDYTYWVFIWITTFWMCFRLS